MKKTFNLLAFVILTLALTSCWDFNREQQIKDAEAAGKSVLIEAENSKKALIETAKAENEAASMKAEAMVKIAKAESDAEIERARGVAEANRIIGESLKGNEIYLKYLQINAILKSEGDKIYIPTEAGLPILEARPK
jgi:hypothetical protein